MRVITLLISTVFMLSSGCQAERHQAKTKIISIADHNLGKSNMIEYNSSKTFALCIQTTTDSHVARKYKFIVIKVSDGTIVYRGSFSLGYVKWLNDNSLEILNSDDVLSGDMSKEAIRIIKIDTQQF